MTREIDTDSSENFGLDMWLTSQGLLRCTGCGAAVVDMDQHVAFHENIARLVIMAADPNVSDDEVEARIVEARGSK